jgi:hypothetical protein
MSERLEKRFGFAGDAGAPVHQRAEHIEKHRLGDFHGSAPVGP